MAGRPPKWGDEDRARVYVVLQAHGGNVRRASRDTGVPISTIHHWVKEWNEDKTSEPDVSLVAEAASDFLSEAERVRDKALRELERKIPSATPSALVAMVGMLTDKAALVRGLATTRVEHKHTLPSAEDLRELVDGFVRSTINASAQRGEIIEGEVLAIEDVTDKS